MPMRVFSAASRLPLLLLLLLLLVSNSLLVKVDRGFFAGAENIKWQVVVKEKHLRLEFSRTSVSAIRE